MKLSVAVALLACAPEMGIRGTKIDQLPLRKPVEHDTTQLAELKTSKGTKDNIQLVDVTSTTTSQTKSAEKIDMSQLWKDPDILSAALEGGTQTLEDAADKKEDDEMMKQYLDEIKSVQDFFQNIEKGI